jgi:hypothetical protein
MAKSDGVDFSLSRAIIVDDAIAGVALIARRGWTTRLAAMSVRPAFRGKGLGRQAMNDLIAESEERGDHRMVLEVIESNTPAVRLYEASGFRVDRRLLGFKVAESAPSDEVATLEDIDIRKRLRALKRRSDGRVDDTLQLGPLTMDLQHKELRCNDERVRLSPREFALTEMLMAKPGRVVPKELIVSTLSNWEADFSENSVEVYVHRLRKRFGELGVVIKTVRGFGYVMEIAEPGTPAAEAGH